MFSTVIISLLIKDYEYLITYTHTHTRTHIYIYKRLSHIFAVKPFSKIILIIASNTLIAKYFMLNSIFI